MTGSGLAHPAAEPPVARGRRLEEAGRLAWRRGASAATLRREGWRWTLWTASVVVAFAAPGVALIAIEPLAFPASVLCFAHGLAVPWIQARRGARSIVPIGGERSVAARAPAGPHRVALGLLGDLVAHRERKLLAATGLALERGALGTWLVGERGALLVRHRGRRVDCFCVRVAEAGELPAADRVAHLLLALREDELGFVTVANLNFSGAAWRVRHGLSERAHPALAAACRPQFG